jgi:hypothetical protein
VGEASGLSPRLPGESAAIADAQPKDSERFARGQVIRQVKREKKKKTGRNPEN